MSDTTDFLAGSGDCWGSSTGSFDNTATSITLIDSGGTDTRSWIPFTVNIDKGVVIISATLKLTAFATSGVSSDNDTMGCEAADNPAAPTTKADLFGRAFTAATSVYSIDQYILDTVYNYDITSSVQEILNRAGWVYGNTMAVLTKWSGAGPHLKRYYSNEGGGGTKMAILEVVTPRHISGGYNLL